MSIDSSQQNEGVDNDIMRGRESSSHKDKLIKSNPTNREHLYKEISSTYREKHRHTTSENMNLKLLFALSTIFGTAALEEDNKPRRLRASGSNIKKSSSPPGSTRKGRRTLTQDEKLFLLENIQRLDEESDDDFMGRLLSLSYSFSFPASFSFPQWDDDDWTTSSSEDHRGSMSMSVGEVRLGEGTAEMSMSGDMSFSLPYYDDDYYYGGSMSMSMSGDMSYPYYDDYYYKEDDHSISMSMGEKNEGTDGGRSGPEMPNLGGEASVF